MIYLKSFSLPSIQDEYEWKLSYRTKAQRRTCYGNNVYPFDLFPFREIKNFDMSDITPLYGGNGSGKSTILNVISEKLDARKNKLFNKTPYFDDYVELCKYTLTGKAPESSVLLRSDDVFECMIDVRSINEGIDRRRDQLFDEYDSLKNVYGNNYFQLSSIEEYDELKRRNEAKRVTKSQYVRNRGLEGCVRTSSNGETAFSYFTEQIKENAIYLLDEPENSLSVKLQIELAKFIEESVRFYGCQFIISTHSPFLLAMKGAKIYDLDSIGAKSPNSWANLPNVRAYYDFFEAHKSDFEKT